MAKNNGKNDRGEKYILSGKMCFGRKGEIGNPLPFKIIFFSRSFRRSRRIGAGKLKRFVARKLGDSNCKKFVLLSGVLKNISGKKKTALRPEAKNNGLFSRAPYEIFF